jgi:hypothetical protein
MYILAQVTQVHFEEHTAYYTVSRADTGKTQRADAEYMEPISNPVALEAARLAATQPTNEDEYHKSLLANPEQIIYEKPQGSLISRTCDVLGCVLLAPFLWTYDGCLYSWYRYIQPCSTVVYQNIQTQARLLLNGSEPYVCLMRLTMVNFIVMCNFWYMFADQARFVIFPPNSDTGLAVVDFIVWAFLVLELLFELFIRPDGYLKSLSTEKAFAFTTRRYINNFHFLIEIFSLMMFVPEFYCLFSSYRCDARIPFSFQSAVLRGVIGPTVLQAFLGRGYLALIRLRVFGVIRHWKNMWITNAFIGSQGKHIDRTLLYAKYHNAAASSHSNKKDEDLSAHFSSGQLHGKQHHRHHNHINVNPHSTQVSADTHRDLSLVNAFNIGTALMVLNSYRALAITWFIAGILPITLVFRQGQINDMARAMTHQLHMTNVFANNEYADTCQYLVGTLRTWFWGIVSPDWTFYHEDDKPYMLELIVEPQRCGVSNSYGSVLAKGCASYLSVSNNSSSPVFDLTTQDEATLGNLQSFCRVWNHSSVMGPEELADTLNIRMGAIVQYTYTTVAEFTSDNETQAVQYSTTAYFDESFTIRTA